MKLAEEECDVLAQAMLERFKCVVRGKGDIGEVAVVARVFDVARLVGVNVPSSDDFLDRYWTTVGPVIFRPRGQTQALGANLRPLLHELGHAVQFWRDPFAMVTKYLTKKGRAELEAEAERGAIEGWWLLTGELPATRDALDVTRHGYAFESAPGEHDDHADLTRDLLETAATSVRAGVLSTDVGLAVATWLTHHAPDALVGRFGTPLNAAD